MEHKIQVAERNIAQFRKAAKRLTGVKILSEVKTGKVLAKSGTSYIETPSISVTLRINGRDHKEKINILEQI